MTLREVPVHTTVKVVKINGEGAFRRRIMDMGITKNSEIYVRKVAPLGDPVEITVRGCCPRGVWTVTTQVQENRRIKNGY